MKGLELARGYYENYGAPMIHEQFPEWEGRIAIGLVGEGSECFGYDDDLSRDHDFEPGFCLFVPEDMDRRTAFLLERAYAKLPKDYGGVQRLRLQPVGGSRHGVHVIGDFYENHVGSRDGVLSSEEWLFLPEHRLATVTNGEIFRDDEGVYTGIRKKLQTMPEDVRRKKIAGHLLLMAQSGQYNYSRCVAHGEPGAAQLALAQFVEHGLRLAFLLNRKYCPFYKWAFRGLRDLEVLADMAEPLTFLLSTENDPDLADTKAAVVEDLAGMVIGLLREQDLSQAICGDLERHAYSVNDGIVDASLRNLHVLTAVTG